MPHKPPPEAVFARAVEARAAGNSWPAVAKLVKRSALTIRKWPRIYAERWTLALRAAGRANIDDAANESVLILRQLLQSKNEKLRAEAAWRLIYQRLEQCKIEQNAGGTVPSAIPGDAYRIAAFVTAHSHEQLIQLLANMRSHQLPDHDGTGVLPAARAG